MLFDFTRSPPTTTARPMALLLGKGGIIRHRGQDQGHHPPTPAAPWKLVEAYAALADHRRQWEPAWSGARSRQRAAHSPLSSQAPARPALSADLKARAGCSLADHGLCPDLQACGLVNCIKKPLGEGENAPSFAPLRAAGLLLCGRLPAVSD